MPFKFLDNDFEVAVRCPECKDRILETLASLDRKEGLVCAKCGARRDAKRLLEKLRQLDSKLNRPLD